MADQKIGFINNVMTPEKIKYGNAYPNIVKYENDVIWLKEITPTVTTDDYSTVSISRAKNDYLSTLSSNNSSGKYFYGDYINGTATCKSDTKKITWLAVDGINKITTPDFSASLSSEAIKEGSIIDCSTRDSGNWTLKWSGSQAETMSVDSGTGSSVLNLSLGSLLNPRNYPARVTLSYTLRVLGRTGGNSTGATNLLVKITADSDTTIDSVIETKSSTIKSARAISLPAIASFSMKLLTDGKIQCKLTVASDGMFLSEGSLSMTITRVEQVSGSTIELDAPTISNGTFVYDVDGNTEGIDVLVKNSNDIALNCNLNFYDNKGNAYGSSGSDPFLIQARSLGYAYINLKSSGEFGSGWKITGYFTTSVSGYKSSSNSGSFINS